VTTSGISVAELKRAMMARSCGRAARSRTAPASFLELPEDDWYFLREAGFAMADLFEGDALQAIERLCRDWFAPGRVYFVSAEARFVKIGFATSPAERISSLQTAHYAELRTVSLIPGTMDLEVALHRRFSAYRARREWFRREGELARFLGRVEAAFIIATEAA